MRIGETLTIVIAKQNVILRPRLRDAFALERRPGGIVALGKALEEQSLEAACIIIRRHTEMLYLENRVFDADVEQLVPILTNYLLALLGFDPFDPKHVKTASVKPTKPRPYIDVLTELFGIATGWLGWSPDDAWAASPMEIAAAYEGRMKMLRAIFGSGDKDAERVTEPQDLDTKAKAIFGKLGTVREQG